MASFNEPANKKKAADCSKRCFPSKEKAFFKAALRHLSSVKLWLKNVVIFSSCCDLGTRAQTSLVKPNFKYFESCTEYVKMKNKNLKYPSKRRTITHNRCLLSSFSSLLIKKAQMTLCKHEYEARAFFYFPKCFYQLFFFKQHPTF